MRRSPWCWLACGLLVGAAARAERLPVAWVSPAPSTDWTAGETITLEWHQTGEWGRGLRVEEWEVFLSLDGGRSYPVRLTPHLESDLRSVRVAVPGLPTSHASLLLRVGDERREAEWRVPGEFVIRGIASGKAVIDHAPAPTRGEAARRGDAGVVLWAEGRRDGGDWRSAATAPAASWWPSIEPQHGGAEAAAAAESPGLEADCRRPIRLASLPAPPEPRPTSPRSPRGIPILRLVERLNE
jgi:hypothetical protein